jgi:hypothetical protein
MYQDFVVKQVLTGEEASLIDAFIGFCHTNLAHNQPHRRHREAGGKATFTEISNTISAEINAHDLKGYVARMFA